ncbi:hypothetical protein MKZ08_09290 [Viridibacillus sp. FSL R5-0477]|uniref:Uncharacterized protein n=1 Tax=Viridibacillus arenosi FSL R5-213 TaxID=1227360 RepID=W4F3C1_9BACL|nr:hypothetical protein [Viridibacillus arenosi]ETT86822.1 hypothetical protein C176_08917 [Viridibacillus arenosi FSL R5-213]OMC88235.1 hypothetical protein BK137_19420 [Viridibacillus arenosi]
MKHSELRKRMLKNEDQIKYLDADLRVVQSKYNIEVTRFFKKHGLIDFDEIFEGETIGKLFQELPESSPIKKAYQKHFKHFLFEMFFNLSIENEQFKIEVFLNNDEYIVLDEEKEKISPMIMDMHKAIERMQTEFMEIQQKFVDMRQEYIIRGEELSKEKQYIQSELNQTQLN